MKTKGGGEGLGWGAVGDNANRGDEYKVESRHPWQMSHSYILSIVCKAFSNCRATEIKGKDPPLVYSPGLARPDS